MRWIRSLVLFRAPNTACRRRKNTWQKSPSNCELRWEEWLNATRLCLLLLSSGLAICHALLVSNPSWIAYARPERWGIPLFWAGPHLSGSLGLVLYGPAIAVVLALTCWPFFAKVFPIVRPDDLVVLPDGRSIARQRSAGHVFWLACWMSLCFWTLGAVARVIDGPWDRLYLEAVVALFHIAAFGQMLACGTAATIEKSCSLPPFVALGIVALFSPDVARMGLRWITV